VENAAVFVGFITAMTFALFLLFKYRMGKVIWAYMGFSGLLIFGVLGGNILMRVLQKLDIAIDMVTVGLLMWNFSIGGVLMTFFWHGPLVVKQGYLICVSTIVSFYFTQIPEWTTWSLLIAMALYDLYAVLTPNGPLRLIVELAQERDEDIPALVYESRGGSFGDARARAQRTTDASGDAGGTDGPSYDPSLEADDEDGEFGLPDSIKLGLGDFIFYSVLVGRAAMWSPITCAFCFIAVLLGLVFTLVALGMYGKALPALPVSIALGSATYFLSRFFLEPAIVQAYARHFLCD
jgi:presenilin 1